MPDSGSPETLVLLHGFTQTGRSWDGVIEALDGERYRALAPDLRGHGAASLWRPVSLEASGADVVALVSGGFALAGYSMGARLALWIALEHPERVTRLILISATAGIEDAVERVARREADARLADAVERDGVEAFAHRWAQQPLFADQPAAVTALAHADRLRSSADGLAASLRGMGQGAMAPLWDRLDELRMPVTVVAGERDARYREIARRIAGAVPGARLVVVSGAGHAVTLEAPHAVAAAIAAGA